MGLERHGHSNLLHQYREYIDGNRDE
jgi:hypothetical protein